MDWAQGVAARLVALDVDRRGRLSGRLLVDDAVRCGLLVDLALAGRLTLTGEAVDVDTSPTGAPLFDDLLAAIAVEPERPLDAWFGERRLTARRVVDALVAGRRWQVRRTVLGRRHLVLDRARAADDVRLDPSRKDLSPADAAVAALGATAHLVGPFRELGYGAPAPEIPPDLLDGAGPHAWVVAAAVDHLRAARTRHLYTGGVLSAGGSLP
ncbi:GPP34 family phosphoprotein [Blastococcus sp. SYSU D00695]